MRILKQSGVLALTLTAALMFSGAWADNASPVGLWRNVDDASGKPRALIRITEANGTLQGKIERVFRAPSEDRNPKCEKCEGALKDVPVIGLVILSGLKKEGAEYTAGKILDPDNGKVYSSKIQLTEGRQEAQRARLHWRVNARAFADLGTPGIKRVLAHLLTTRTGARNMTQLDQHDTPPSVQDVAIIVGGGPGISSSCARLFAENGVRVGIAARNPEKSVLQNLEKTHGVRRYACDATEPAAVELLFQSVIRDLGAPTLVVHNIDGRVPGIFRKGITEADPSMALETLRNSAFSAYLVGQHAARLMRENRPGPGGTKGTIIFTNASAALKGFPMSAAFAMACHAKSGLAQSMARELMPQGIHVANVPIDAAIGWTQEDGTRAHRLAGTTVDDNMADPDRIAETYLHLHRQHRSTWAFEVVLRPWVEKW